MQVYNEEHIAKIGASADLAYWHATTNRRIIRCSWLRPSEGTWAINYDGTCQNLQGVWGAAVRYFEGNFIAAANGKVRYSNLVHWGTWHWGWVAFNGRAYYIRNVVGWVSGGTCPWKVKVVLGKIRIMIEDFKVS